MSSEVSALDTFTRSVNAEALAPPGGLAKQLALTGRLPPVQLLILPLPTSPLKIANIRPLGLQKFLSYKFSSSVLVPVDNFSFTFTAPDDPIPLSERVSPGDIAVLSANGIAVCTGLIDRVTIEVTDDGGEKATVSGRNMLAQLADQDSVSIDGGVIQPGKYTALQVATMLCLNTRIPPPPIPQLAPVAPYLFATQPGESKMASLMRFMEPLNIIAWSRGDGRLIIGRPLMARPPNGKLILNKLARISNVLSMRVTRDYTTIPTSITPIWQGQEFVIDKVPRPAQPAIVPEIAALFAAGHRLPKTVVVSHPDAQTPAELSGVNALATGGGDLLNAYAQRAMARALTNSMIVQAVVPGHYNDFGLPFTVDQVYFVSFDRGGVQKLMYVYQAEWEMSESEGQRTNLYLCNLGSIVSGIRAP